MYPGTCVMDECANAGTWIMPVPVPGSGTRYHTDMCGVICL
eukprot:SAG11_NODE_29444_length_310_cov_4.706161_1_plen_40_part_01